MGHPPASADNAFERATEAIRLAEDCDALRSAQAVLLPLLGFTLEQTAQVVGRDRYWVSRARNRMLRGDPPPKKHGGRRHALVTGDQEAVLVKKAIARAGAFGPGVVQPHETVTVRQALRQLLDERAASPVSESTITKMLNRAAPKILPGGKANDLLNLAPALARLWHYEALVARLTGRADS